MNVHTDTIRFFQPPRDYFWHWEVKDTVLEFANGRTICYREDLNFILESLDLPDSISLGAILLILCACKDNHETLYEPVSYLFKLGYNVTFTEEEHIAAKDAISRALLFMNVINSLPFTYRSGLKRIALIQAILDQQGGRKSKRLQTVNNLFKSGQLDERIFGQYQDFSYRFIQTDIQPLADALQLFPDAATLELKLRTGVTTLPEKGTLAVPTPVPDDLMGQLAIDMNTAGVARLSRKIMAALNIPMHLSGASDQSVGGISDISNRGHYDKLLLSELAQDDLLLTARLANNEALFLQREQLPATQNQDWHILLDTSLKMWGTPRIFALAAGLAFAENRKKEPMQALALGGNNSVPVDLGTKAGILAVLEKLEPALHCGNALQKTLHTINKVKGRSVLILGAHYKEDADFMAIFLPLREQLDFLVEVGRSGHIALYETLGKRNKLINKALIDLDEVLFNKRRSIRKNYDITGLPAMLQVPDFPLLFPASKIRLKPGSVFRFAQNRVAVLTQDRRVLCWTDKYKGAEELIEKVATGEPYWAESKNQFLLLIRNYTAKEVWIYQLDTEHEELLVHQLSDIAASEVKFDQGLFYLSTDAGVVSVDPYSGKLIPQATTLKNLAQTQVTPHFTVLGQIKKMINNGYSVINSAKAVFVHTAGGLFIDQRQLKLEPHGRHMSWVENKIAAVEWIKPIRQENMEIEHLSNLKFTKFVWADGSEAVLDSRGLLHLKSSDQTVPESSIILVIEKTIACWSADGKISGSPYFTGNQQMNVMLAADFYQQYIQRFIAALR